MPPHTRPPQEPRKADLLRSQADSSLLLPRQALCTIILPARMLAVDCVVELSRKAPEFDCILSWTEVRTHIQAAWQSRVVSSAAAFSY